MRNKTAHQRQAIYLQLALNLKLESKDMAYVLRLDSIWLMIHIRLFV